jgi:hypothetical protein
MEITIKGALYTATQLGVEWVRVESAKGDVYDVTRVNGRVSCDCCDYRYRHTELPYSDGCKHVKAVVEAGLVKPPEVFAVA